MDRLFQIIEFGEAGAGLVIASAASLAVCGAVNARAVARHAGAAFLRAVVAVSANRAELDRLVGFQRRYFQLFRPELLFGGQLCGASVFDGLFASLLLCCELFLLLLQRGLGRLELLLVKAGLRLSFELLDLSVSGCDGFARFALLRLDLFLVVGDFRSVRIISVVRVCGVLSGLLELGSLGLGAAPDLLLPLGVELGLELDLLGVELLLVVGFLRGQLGLELFQLGFELGLLGSGGLLRFRELFLRGL